MPFKQFKRKEKSSFLVVSVVWLIIFSACEGSQTTNGPSPDKGAISFSIDYRGAEGNFQPAADKIDCARDGIAKIQADVHNTDGDRLVRGDSWNCVAGHGQIKAVPAKDDLTIVILGKDDKGRIVFRGQKTDVVVIADDNTHVGTIECNAFVPRLQSPADDSAVRADGIVLEWTSVEGSNEYQILVSENSDMDDPVIAMQTAETTYTVSGLSTDKTYYWQVYANDIYENKGFGTETRSFTVSESAPPTATGKLPDTGQTSSHTERFGEDSDYEINLPAFTKLDASGGELDAGATEWVAVRDEVTGLIWEIKTDDDTVHDKDNTYAWQQSQSEFIGTLNTDHFAGCANWRLPTIKESATLVNYDAVNPALSSALFPNTQQVGYWSSTSFALQDKNAWNLMCDSGNIYPTIPKSESRHVRAVCGDEKGYDTNNILDDNGDGTVSDVRTGLMWQKAAKPESATWEEAITYCEELDLANHDDWRLPNIRELQSIIDFRRKEPAIETAVFPGTELAPYWTSTTKVDPKLSDHAWYIEFKNGRNLSASKYEAHYVRAVRGGK